MLIPPRLLPPTAAALLRANSVFIVECDRIWALKQARVIGPRRAGRLFARASRAHDRAVGRGWRPARGDDGTGQRPWMR